MTQIGPACLIFIYIIFEDCPNICKYIFLLDQNTQLPSDDEKFSEIQLNVYKFTSLFITAILNVFFRNTSAKTNGDGRARQNRREWNSL